MHGMDLETRRGREEAIHLLFGGEAERARVVAAEVVRTAPAIWASGDEGKTWAKTGDVTRNSARNHSYVRKVFNAEPDSPFAVLWADGHADKLSISRLYFGSRDGSTVRRLPYDMDDAYATPETVEFPE